MALVFHGLQWDTHVLYTVRATAMTKQQTSVEHILQYSQQMFLVVNNYISIFTLGETEAWESQGVQTQVDRPQNSNMK